MVTTAASGEAQSTPAPAAATAAPGPGSLRIGYIDVQRVLARSAAGVAAREQLEKERAGIQKEMDGRRQELEKLRYDLYYVKHVSVWLDLRILADTCRVLVSGRLPDGAEDAAPGSKTVRAPSFRAPRKLNPTRAA